MNRFKYKSTAVTKSEFDLTKLKGGEKIDGSAEVTVAIGIPKDSEVNRMVRCKIAMNITGEDNEYRCYIQTVNDFAIVDLTDQNALVKDAKEFCVPKTMEELSKRLDQLLSIQMGKKINIPIPSISVNKDILLTECSRRASLP